MRRGVRDSTGLREITFETAYTKHAEGSCLVKMGDTWVLCNATIEDKVPPWMDGKKKGWVTAEYSMLPRATNTRTKREAISGRLTGRTQEIQRLIGRALRACVKTEVLGERTILVDCDVLQADGGTRTASINGGFVALVLAVQQLQKKGVLATSPISSQVAAISVGMKDGVILTDLDYGEDSTSDVDMNFVMLANGKIVEMQGTAEGTPFSFEEAQLMMSSARAGIEGVFERQRSALAL